MPLLTKAKAKNKPAKQNPAEEPDEEAQEEAENIVTPDACFDHDETSYFIDVELPGVKKEQIDLSIGPQSLCLEAPRANGELVYLGCFTLAHTVDETKAKATYENGLLRIEVPLKAPIKGKRIQIE